MTPEEKRPFGCKCQTLAQHVLGDGCDEFNNEMAMEIAEAAEAYKRPPCQECGAMTPEEAETKCNCAGDKDDCHGCQLWPEH